MKLHAQFAGKKDQNLDSYHAMGKFSTWQIDIFLIFPRKQNLHFMQIVSIWDDLPDVPDPFFRKNKKYFKMLSAEIFTQHAKC